MYNSNLDYINNKLYNDNLLLKHMEESRGAGDSAKYKIEQWQESFPELSDVNLSELSESLDAEQRIAQEDYEIAGEVLDKAKQELDNELIDIFGVSSINDIKYDWIKVALTGGNLQNDTEWETEEEFDILISASERLTPERAEKLHSLSKNVASAKKDLSKSFTDEREKGNKKEVVNKIQNNRTYRVQFERLQDISKRIARQMEQHDKLMHKINQQYNKSLKEIEKTYSAVESTMDKFTTDIVNRSTAVKNIRATYEMLTYERLVEEQEISEKTALQYTDFTATKYRTKAEDFEKLTEKNQEVLNKTSNLMNEIVQTLNPNNTDCNNPEQEKKIVEQKQASNSTIDEEEQYAKIDTELARARVWIDEFCDKSMTSELGEYEGSTSKISYYLEQLYNNFDINNLTNYNEQEVNDMLATLTRELEYLTACDDSLKRKSEQIQEDATELIGVMNNTIFVTQTDNADYVYGTNDWIVKGLDALQEVCAESQNMPENIQQAFNEYLQSQLAECKQSAEAFEERTNIEIPVSFKQTYNDLKQKIKLEKQQTQTF